MQVTGMLHGAKLLQFAGFPTSEVLGPAASEGEIKDLISRHGSVFIKPVFKGGVGKKGKAGLLGRAKDLQSALKEKERLYFAEHRVGNNLYKANGVTFDRNSLALTSCTSRMSRSLNGASSPLPYPPMASSATRPLSGRCSAIA